MRGELGGFWENSGVSFFLNGGKVKTSISNLREFWKIDTWNTRFIIISHPGQSLNWRIFFLWYAVSPHSSFAVMIMIYKLWAFSLYLQSTPDSIVNYVPVFASPCALVVKGLGESSEIVPILLVHSDCSIAVVVPVSFGNRATSSTS